MPEIIPVNVDAPDEMVVHRTAEVLLQGGNVALPTDTIYGLCGRTENPTAIESLYAIKGRKMEKGFPILIGDVDQLSLLSGNISSTAHILIENFWPGSLTLIFPARVGLSPFLCQEEGIAVRLPAQALCQALARKSGPFAATSANRTGSAPLENAQAIADEFGKEIILILDGGLQKNRTPSTVVDTRGNSPKLIREGNLSFEQIRSVWSASISN